MGSPRTVNHSAVLAAHSPTNPASWVLAVIGTAYLAALAGATGASGGPVVITGAWAFAAVVLLATATFAGKPSARWVTAAVQWAVPMVTRHATQLCAGIVVLAATTPDLGLSAASAQVMPWAVAAVICAGLRVLTWRLLPSRGRHQA